MDMSVDWYIILSFPGFQIIQLFPATTNRDLVGSIEYNILQYWNSTYVV